MGHGKHYELFKRQAAEHRARVAAGVKMRDSGSLGVSFDGKPDLYTRMKNGDLTDEEAREFARSTEVEPDES